MFSNDLVFNSYPTIKKIKKVDNKKLKSENLVLVKTKEADKKGKKVNVKKSI